MRKPPPNNAGKVYAKRPECRRGHARSEHGKQLGNGRWICKACSSEAGKRWYVRRGRERFQNRHPGVVEGYDEPC